MKKRIFSKTLLAAAVLITTQQVSAAGFQLNSQSATGLGRAFAGDAVIADNASVMARNAAAMALFDKTEMSLGFTAITTMIDVSDATYTAFPQHPSSKGHPSDYDDAGGTSFAPNVHLIVPINNKFALGFNAYTNFGTKTDFQDSATDNEYGGLSDVKSINLGLAASYRINQQWSIGGGLDIIYGSGKLKRTTSKQLGSLPALDVDADGWGLGFNLGTVFELNEDNRFGLSYHYSPEVTATGDFGGLAAGSKELYLPLPDMLEFSGFHKITDTKFAVHYSVQWIGWSAFKTLDTDKGELSNYEWKDAYHFALGGTYYLNDDWTLRTGYMYDISAQDEVTSMSVPDSDRQWFSAGFTYHLDKKSNIDFGFTYLLGKDVDVHEETKKGPLIVSEMKATTHADAILVGLQYSRSF